MCDELHEMPAGFTLYDQRLGMKACAEKKSASCPNKAQASTSTSRDHIAASAQSVSPTRRASIPRPAKITPAYPGEKFGAPILRSGPIGPLRAPEHAQLAWFCFAPAAGNRIAVDRAALVGLDRQCRTAVVSLWPRCAKKTALKRMIGLLIY